MHHPTDRIAHTTAFVTPVVEHWLEQEIAQWDHLREDKPLLLLLTVTGRKEMFYLMTHSTHFYLWLYGVRHMVKDHSDSEKGNLLPPHGLLFLINS